MADCGKKWGIYMFIGEYHHSIDDKGRLIIPSKFREELGNNFIITRGIENCLFVYSLDSWNEIVRKIESLPLLKKTQEHLLDFSYQALVKQNLINRAVSILPPH